MQPQSFLDFLTEAKRSTYAAQGDDASVSPMLPGSKQLEYRNGDYLYRDIYFGFAFFTGQEIVEYRDRPVWSMTYSGGVLDSDAPKETVGAIYAFLREALRQVDVESIYRGPRQFESGAYRYVNEFEGSPACFHGRELILLDGRAVYELFYGGGTIR